MGEQGELLFLAYAGAEGGGISNRQRKQIRLRLIAPGDDTILTARGLAALRQTRLLRLCRQAFEQGAVLTYEDLVHLLSTSPSTLKRDVRMLQRQGLAVPLHRKRGRRPGTLLCLILLTLLWSSSPVAAQISSLFGSVGLEYEYETLQSADRETERQALRQQYNLGVDGRILDPRLAHFSLSGTFGNTTFSEDDSRALSFDGNLTLLQGLPYSLTLRHAQSFARNTTDTDITFSGLSFRLALPTLPQLSLTLDRTTIDSQEPSPSDQVFTNGSLRISQRSARATVEGEFGVQIFQDKLRDTSRERYFARLSDTVTLSPTTTFRAVANAFNQDDQTFVDTAFSLINRPDPSLSRSLAFGYQFSETEAESIHSANLAGVVSKSFSPFPRLVVRPFTSLSVAGDSIDGLNRVEWVGGETATVSYFTPVLIFADYRLGLGHEADESGLDLSHQIHLGFASQTLDPWRLSGDYFLTLDRNASNRTRHFIVARADVSLATNLYLRSFVDYTHEDSQFSDSSTSSIERDLIDDPLQPRFPLRLPDSFTSTIERDTINVGISASYQPLFNLSLDASGIFRRTESPTTSETIFRAITSLNYIFSFAGRPTLNVEGVWERFSLNDETRYEIHSRLSYLIGQLTFSLEYRFETRDRADTTDQEHSIFIRLFRPFRKVF